MPDIEWFSPEPGTWSTKCKGRHLEVKREVPPGGGRARYFPYVDGAPVRLRGDGPSRGHSGTNGAMEAALRLVAQGYAKATEAPPARRGSGDAAPDLTAGQSAGASPGRGLVAEGHVNGHAPAVDPAPEFPPEGPPADPFPDILPQDEPEHRPDQTGLDDGPPDSIRHPEPEPAPDDPRFLFRLSGHLPAQDVTGAMVALKAALDLLRAELGEDTVECELLPPRVVRL